MMHRALLLISVLLTGVAPVPLTGFAPPEPVFRVAPYLQFGTQTSMVVLWETEEAATTLVEYGESRYGDQAPNLSESVELDGTRTMHEVVLTDLKPETKYFWRVVSVLPDGSELASEPSTFRTAVHDSTAFAFVFYSDTQSNPKVWGKLAELGFQERPNFGVHAGDLVDRGGAIDDWLVEFFPPGHVFMSRYPLYTTLGNHEDDHDNYYRYFHNPEPEYYYTFRYGNAQFFMVDTNRDVSEGSEQWNWLEWELAKSDADWKFVVHHHPPYSSEENDHGNSWAGSTTYGTHARDLVPLYEQHDVDFCLFGHVHMYERTWPLFEGEVNQKNGVIYINGGGGGGGLEQFAPTRSWFSAKVKSAHHYTLFAIAGQTLQFQAIDVDGRLFDSFELRKDAVYDPEVARARVVVPPAPRVAPHGGLFLDEQQVQLEALFEDMTIHYTLDGTTPTPSSPRYTGPIDLTGTATLKAVAVSNDGTVSRVKAVDFRKEALRPAERVTAQRPGLAYRYYEGRWELLPAFDALQPLASGSAEQLDLEALKQADDSYGLVFEGYVEAPSDGIYTFEVLSDDGTKLYIGDALVVDNDGSHSSRRRDGQVALEAGKHPVRLEYFEDHGDEALTLSWSGPEFDKQHIRPRHLSH